jgi:hypothetical protein
VPQNFPCFFLYRLPVAGEILEEWEVVSRHDGLIFHQGLATKKICKPASERAACILDKFTPHTPEALNT